MTTKKSKRPGAPGPGSGTWDALSKKRTAVVARHTAETRIDLQLTIEGKGRYKISTGIRFFDHMLELFTHHGAFDLELKCDGDLDVDQHHTVETHAVALAALERRSASASGAPAASENRAAPRAPPRRS